MAKDDYDVILSCVNIRSVQMKAKYIADHETLALIQGKIYDVISVEKGWYRIMTELEEDYLFPPEAFEIVEN